MKTNSVRVEVLREAFSKLRFDDTKWLVELNELNSWTDTHKHFGVNWSCCGAQESDIVDTFINQLNIARELADKLNKLDLEVEKKYNAFDDLIINENEYQGWVVRVAKWIEEGRIYDVVDFVAAREV